MKSDNDDNNNNYPLTLDGLPTFISQKSLSIINEHENINLNVQPNIVKSNVIGNSLITNNNKSVVLQEASKLHLFSRFRYSNELRKKYEDHLEKTNHSEKELIVSLNKLRSMIYEFGLPDGSEVILYSDTTYKYF
ncbi:hypothetical protein BCR36DRAFT_31662 [Piromyces finnis]|uniref:Uncharacterized protein n=1 Tax=Piromyces finnis TaxID=1754191 RepID=A0A1Y1VCI6_9FUNG|nr:hypothetical protein BCR36DRAFT_31662 [Piromyces finnis]|eukprot:ORX52586.1 hypothetical protein BCR36DRAFT_31662 [Piromyces finnis]